MRQLQFAIAFLFLVIFFGTIGYVVIEGWDPIDAFYMTVISITTTGFAEIRPLSHTGRMFTVAIIILGVSTIAYIGGRTAQVFIESRLLLFRRRRVNKKIEKLENHYIVCGFGRLGKPICDELKALKAPFVVIEKNEEIIDELIEADYLFVNGDATSDETLMKAGLQRARGVIAVLPSDAENVYVTLSSKVLKPDIFIVSRAIEDETEQKLKRAGANRIVKPYEIGASRMVNLLIRPGVVDFIDIVARTRGLELNLEEIVVRNNSALRDKTLAESSLRQKLNIIVVAIFREDGKIVYNPTSSEKILEGDRLIAIGQMKDLVELNKLCG
jgi:voltage-gated potassium channel